MDSNSPVAALVGTFAVGFAVQRLMDVVETTYVALFVPGDDDRAANRKKALLGWLSLVAGLALAKWVGVLAALGYTVPLAVDVVVTALIVSAGTEWFNAFVKFISYAKDEKKEEKATAQAERKITETVAKGVSPAVLERLTTSAAQQGFTGLSPLVRAAALESFCLTRLRAEKVVKRCIRRVAQRGQDDPIEDGDTLSKCGIRVQPNVDRLLTMIIADPAHGVRAEGCALRAGDLEASVDTEVAELVDQVFARAR
jgi:hypothetical protein